MAQARLASVDGRIGPPEEATISILDDGLLRGDGVFEVVKLYAGRPFRLGDHLQRLARSAAALQLPFDEDALRAEIEALLAAGEEPEGCLRVVLTRGGRRLLLIERNAEWAASVRIALLVLSPNEILTGVKSISYAANMQATRIAAGRGADEAVFVRPDGIVLEAPTAAVFWTGAGGVLRTPALEVGILDSITRDAIVHELEVHEGVFARDDLLNCHEAFLVSTTREVQPVSAIDGVGVATVDGPAARAARDALAAVVERDRRAARG